MSETQETNESDAPTRSVGVERIVSCGGISELATNLRRVFKKMHRELEPGNDSHSNMIDLVNHADTLAQQIESQLALNELTHQAQELDMGYGN